jgi:hypothetical protein
MVRERIEQRGRRGHRSGERNTGGGYAERVSRAEGREGMHGAEQ